MSKKILFIPLVLFLLLAAALLFTLEKLPQVETKK